MPTIDVEMARRCCYNIRQMFRSLDKNKTTHFYSFVLLCVKDPEKKICEYDKEIPILLVCNRWRWIERIRMFNFTFLVFTTDFLDGIQDLKNGVELKFDEEDALEATQTNPFPRH